MNVRDIRSDSRRIEAEGVVKALGERREVRLRTGAIASVCDATFADESGEISVSLWDSDIGRVKVGSRVRIQNGYAKTFRGQLQLNIGRYGRLYLLDAEPKKEEPQVLVSAFPCGVPNCRAKFDSIASLQKHIRSHK